MFLDSSFCIDLMREERRGERGPASRKFESLDSAAVFVPLFVVCELDAGARGAQDPEKALGELARLTERVPTVYPSSALPAAYGGIVAYLRKRGTPIPVMDALIGAMAKLAGQPLLVRHPEHFALIPGLTIETYG